MVAKRDKSVVLTGERRNRHFLVTIEGQPVWLSATLWTALCELVLGRGRSESGFVPLSPVTVCRLRKALSHAIGEGASDSVIETGAVNEYRLGRSVGMTRLEEAFTELREKHLVSDLDMDCLVGSCPLLKSR